MGGSGGNAKREADLAPGPWAKWRTRKRAERAIRFIETYCRATKGYGYGKPIRLARFQKRWIRNACADGISSAVLSVARGNGKSTLLAAFAVWALFDPDPDSGAPQVPIVATTVGQAIRAVYGEAVAMIKAEPELERRAQVFTAIGFTKVLVPGNGGEMFPIADKVDGLQGLDPSVAILDEVGFASIETWQALLLASGKRPRSLVIGIGTHGVTRDNALAWMHVLVEQGTPPDGLHYECYSAPVGCDIHDESLWPLANPALDEGFMNIAAIRTAVAMSPEAQVRIYRLNQFGVDGVDGWLGQHGRELWASLEDPYDFVPKAPTWVGVDVGLKRDSTAVVWGQKRPDGRLHAKARIWLPTPDREVDVTDVMQFLRELTLEFDVLEVPYDPRLFDLPAKILSDEGLPMLEFPQSIERMTPAVGACYADIVRGGLSHDADKLFASQVLNAAPRNNIAGFTLAKGKSLGRIDAAVSMAIMHDRAMRSKARRRSPLVIG